MQRQHVKHMTMPGHSGNIVWCVRIEHPKRTIHFWEELGVIYQKLRRCFCRQLLQHLPAQTQSFAASWNAGHVDLSD